MILRPCVFTQGLYFVIMKNMRRRSILLCILIMCMFAEGCSVPGSAVSGNAVRDSESGAESGIEGHIGDGTYKVDVGLSGGSGKASVTSPATLTVTDGKMTAEIVWSSDKYDYMLVDGEKYLRLNEELGIEGDSVFRIPVSELDKDITVIADTTAMSVPHEIEYTLRFKLQGTEDEGSGYGTDEEHKRVNSRISGSNVLKGIRTDIAADGTYIPVNIAGDDGRAIGFDNTVNRRYADMFTIAYSDDGYYYIHIEQTGDIIIVPEGKSVSILNTDSEDDVYDKSSGDEESDEAGDNEDSDKENEAVVLCKPFENIYLVSTAAMDVFAAIDEELSDIRFCSLDKKEWYVKEAAAAFDAGTLEYAGKYSAPDYERLLAGDCDLAIENTMIYHKPEVIDKLDSLGIPVIVEASSYESHPFGRIEWIKLYGALTDRLTEAEEIFDERLREVEPLVTEYEKNSTAGSEETGKKKSVAFFYVTSNGAVNVRKSNDYVSRMIEIAGGEYVPGMPEDDGNALSTVNMQMESFYAEAGDADILIYNGTIAGGIDSIGELLDKDRLFADFKAVKTGEVYSTDKNMYQETMSIPMMVMDMNRILKDDKVSDKELIFLKRIE